MSVGQEIFNLDVIFVELTIWLGRFPILHILEGHKSCIHKPGRMANWQGEPVSAQEKGLVSHSIFAKIITWLKSKVALMR